MNIHFLAGYQRGTQVGHSVAVRYVVSDAHDPKSKQLRHDPSDDWALIELREPVGARAGYLGWHILDAATLKIAMQSGSKITLAGYPYIREHVMSVGKECDEVRIDDVHNKLVHNCAAASGDTGGPILLIENGNATIIAIDSGIDREIGKVIWTATPIANFYRKILGLLGGDVSLQQIDGRTGLSGKPPAR